MTLQQVLEKENRGESPCLRWTRYLCVTCLVPVNLLEEKYWAFAIGEVLGI